MSVENITSKTYYHSGEWTKGKVGTMSTFAALGVVALTAWVALLVIKHCHMSVSFLPTSSMPDAALYSSLGVGYSALIIAKLLFDITRAKARKFQSLYLRPKFSTGLNALDQVQETRNDKYSKEIENEFEDGDRLVVTITNQTDKHLHYFASKATKEASNFVKKISKTYTTDFTND